MAGWFWPGRAALGVGERRAGWARSAGVFVLVLALAALPRLTSGHTLVTADEPRWFTRTIQFGASVAARDWAGTYQSGHPGVTVLWLGALATGFQPVRSAEDSTLRTFSEPVRAEFWAARRTLALAASALLALVVLLAARVVGMWAALLGGVLLALDPWLVAHSRILHLDGLLSLLAAVAVLSSLAYWQCQGGSGFLVLSGVAAGLAVLTKSSALAFLPPVLLLLATGGAWPARPGGWRRLLQGLGLQAGIASVTALIVWPALWVDPLGTTLRVLRFGLETGGVSHGLGSFFLGHEINDPGPLFYPVALAFRLSPLALLGLVAWALPRRGWLGRMDSMRATRWLAASAVVIVLVMAAAPKKQDRYVLPTVPLVSVVAATGLCRAVAATISRAEPRSLAVGGLGLAQLALCASTRPVFFSAYSPLLGGGAVAQQVIPVGWGEGLRPIVRYLNQRLSSPGQTVAVPTTVRLALEAQLRARVRENSSPRHADYQVTYINAEQRGHGASKDGRLVLTVRINGVDYAHLYDLQPARVNG